MTAMTWHISCIPRVLEQGFWLWVELHFRPLYTYPNRRKLYWNSCCSVWLHLWCSFLQWYLRRWIKNKNKKTNNLEKSKSCLSWSMKFWTIHWFAILALSFVYDLQLRNLLEAVWFSIINLFMSFSDFKDLCYGYMVIG